MLLIQFVYTDNESLSWTMKLLGLTCLGCFKYVLRLFVDWKLLKI